MKKRGYIIEEIRDDIKELKLMSELSVANARMTLDQLCDRYLELGYIPKEEYDVFSMLGEAYLKANGNHGTDNKYMTCIERLKIQ